MFPAGTLGVVEGIEPALVQIVSRPGQVALLNAVAIQQEAALDAVLV